MDWKPIDEDLHEYRTDRQAAYYKKVVPDSKPALGVCVPILRRMAKEIAREDYRLFMEQYGPCEYLEQDLLKAFVIGYARDETDTILQTADAFIPRIQDWMVSDAFCQNFSMAKKHRREVFAWLQSYIESDQEFFQRVAAVMLMSHFLVDGYYEQVLSVLGRLRHPGYYARMGVAWCAATALAVYPQAGMTYLQGDALEQETWHKAVQKALESYRVSDENKAILRAMKRERHAAGPQNENGIHKNGWETDG